MYGEVYIVEPGDPALAALLDAFRDEATKRAQAINDIESAENSLVSSALSFGLGLFGVASGGATAVFSCATVPLTFWAMGGTGWSCAGGVAVTLVGAGLAGLSIGDGTQAWDDRSDAIDNFHKASDEAEELFGSIRDHITALP